MWVHDIRTGFGSVDNKQNILGWTEIHGWKIGNPRSIITEVVNVIMNTSLRIHII